MSLNRPSLLLGLLLAALPGPAMASGGGWLLKLDDPEGLLDQAPQIVIIDPEGRATVVAPRDDGLPPDATAGDGTWSSPMAGVLGATIELQVMLGETRWGGTAERDLADPLATVHLALSADGLRQVDVAPQARAPIELDDELQSTTGPGAPTTVVHLEPWWGNWLWLALLVGLGAGLGATLLRQRAAREPDPSPADGLEALRARIDRLDGELLRVLAERARVVEAVGTLKAREGSPVHRPEREAELLASRERLARELGLKPSFARALFERILARSRADQER